MTLLKNEGDLLLLSRAVRKVAVIGPHAASVMVGFPHYTYLAALIMLRIASSVGRFRCRASTQAASRPRASP